MQKKLKNPGKNISAQAEIQNISRYGIWILVKEKEFFLPFSQFPWFLQAPLEHIYNLELFHEKHLHWPTLDIDIELENLKNPQLYPLKYS